MKIQFCERKKWRDIRCILRLWKSTQSRRDILYRDFVLTLVRNFNIRIGRNSVTPKCTVVHREGKNYKAFGPPYTSIRQEVTTPQCITCVTDEKRINFRRCSVKKYSFTVYTKLNTTIRRNLSNYGDNSKSTVNSPCHQLFCFSSSFEYWYQKLLPGSKYQSDILSKAFQTNQKLKISYEITNDPIDVPS